MAETYTKTAIALQGGGALGAYAFGALKRIYESEPNFRPSAISGVSIGAFTAAIVASHPDDPVPKLQAFWDDLTVLHSAFLPPSAEKFLAYFGNSAFYWPRLDYFRLPFWTNIYDLSPIKRTLQRYIDFDRIAKREVKLVVTATNIESGEIEEFSNDDPAKPITMEHLIASVAACRRAIRRARSAKTPTGTEACSTTRRSPRCSVTSMPPRQRRRARS